jgi:hypothetical protein
MDPRRLSLHVVDAPDGGIQMKARVLRRDGLAGDWRPTAEGFTIPLPQEAGDPLEVFLRVLRNAEPFYTWDIVRLVRRGLWPDVMARVIEIGELPDQSRINFALALPSPHAVAIDHGVDLHAWLDSMRILLPAYRGPSLRLFRGQARADSPGVYWSQFRQVAELFADGGVLLTATVPADAVLLPNHSAFEYLIDPRDADYEIVQRRD